MSTPNQPNQEQLYYCSVNGNESGPFNAAQLKQLVEEGRLSQTDAVRRGQSMNWHSAASMRGLFSDPPPVQEEYFYYDSKTAERKGPYNQQELKSLAERGVIKKDTVIETPDGKTTEAGSVTGIWISFPPIPPPRDDDDTNDDFSPIPPKRDDDDTFTTSAPVGGFLDITFTRFITNWVVPIYWCISLALAIGAVFVIPAIAFFILTTQLRTDAAEAIMTAFGIFVLLIPMLLFWLLNVRIVLEATMVFFRMEKHLRKMSSGD